MDTQKVAYWLALAVFGLALHSEYRHGSFPTLHRASDRASFTVGRLARCAERTVAMAKLLAIRQAPGTDDLLAADNARELADSQAEMLREQVQGEIESRRGQAQDGAELLRDRTRARAEMIRALFDVRRAQFERARAQMSSQIFIGNSANRRLIEVRPNDCRKAGTRIAITGSNSSSDGDEDSDQE
ncbi:MAG: hypothetical protein WAU58_09650 [Terriglobales bacterium]